MAASAPVVIASDQSAITVTGTVTTAGLTDTQLRASAVPVSLAALPALAAGGNVIGGVTQSGTWNIGAVTTLPALVAGSAIIGKVGIDQSTPGTSNAVSITNASLAVTAAALPLPTGAASDATLTGGTAKAISRGGAKGTTTAADVTSTVAGVNHQAIDVAIYNAAGTLLDPTAIRALTSADQITIANATLAVTATSLPLPTGAATSANQPSNAAAGSTTSGQTGIMNIGAVTTAAPAYTTGQSNFFSLNTAGGLRVDGSGVTQPVSFTQQALPANQSVNASQINGVTPLMGNGVTGTGSLRVTVASDNTAFPTKVSDGTNVAAVKAGVIAVAGDNPLVVTMHPSSAPMTNQAVSGTVTNSPIAAGSFTLNSAATTNASSVKNAAGNLYSLIATNNGSAVAFAKIYNKGSAPTVGTDTPVLVAAIPANGVPLNLLGGSTSIRFTTGIALALTNLIADSDTTAVAAGQIKVMMNYL